MPATAHGFITNCNTDAGIGALYCINVISNTGLYSQDWH